MGARMEYKTTLLDQMRQVLRLTHLSIRTEEAYVSWVRRFILFHDKRHPKEMGASEIRAFLSHLALQEQVAASTHNSALNALLFLYRRSQHLVARARAARRARRPVAAAR